MGLFDELDALTQRSRDNILKPLFAYPGGKSKSAEKIVDILPHSSVYVEPFGGSAAVLLCKAPCKLDVYNDRWSGVVDFYRCIRSPELCDKLCAWLELTVHSREDFCFCRETWKNTADIVERAGRWYYMVQYSFGSLGRNFGRSTTSKARLASIRDRLPLFAPIHERFKYVQIENQDWEQCCYDYDSEDTVFYLDPPYLGTDSGIYGHKMPIDAHRHLLDVVFRLKGFVALSGYDNSLYNNRDWDDRHEWKAFVSIQSLHTADGGYKEMLANVEKRGHATEVLWIKESR